MNANICKAEKGGFAPSFIVSCLRCYLFTYVSVTLTALHTSQMYIESLCHGNLLEEEAIHISNIFKSNFSVPPLPVESRHQERVICLPSSANFVRNVSVKNRCETNSVVEVVYAKLVIYLIIPKPLFFYNLKPSTILWFCLQIYFQIEQENETESIKLKVLVDLFDEIVEEPFFNELR